MANDMTTIGQLLEQPPSQGTEKSWVNGSFQAIVRNGEFKQARSGNWYGRCLLQDPQLGNITIAAIGEINFQQMDGCLVEIGGTGITREDFKGKPQIKMGKTAMCQIIGSGRMSNPPGGQAPPPQQQQQPPQGYAPPAQGYQPPPQQQQAPPAASQAQRVAYGPAVGNAIEIAARAIVTAGLAVPGTPKFASLLFEVGSDVLRISEFMEGGKLAPLATERSTNPPAQAQAPPGRVTAFVPPPAQAPPPQQQVVPPPQPVDIDEEDVPF